MGTRTSFRKKLLLLTIVPLAVAQIVTLYAVMRTVETDVESRARDSLAVGGRVVGEFLASRREQLRTGVEVLSADFGLKEATATGDDNTIQSVLSNHSQRLGADMALVLDIDGTGVAGTMDNMPTGNSNFLHLVRNSDDTATFESTLTLNGATYQTFAAPLRAPMTIGWIVLGFRVDNVLLDRIAALTGLGVTFIGVDSGNNSTISTTKPSLQSGKSPAGLFDNTRNYDHVYMVNMFGYECLTLAKPLVRDRSDVLVVLQRSMLDAMAPYVEARRGLIIFAAALLFFVSAAAAWYSMGIVRPLKTLTDAARRMISGQYDDAIRVDSDDEMGELADSFNTMQNAIAERERRISHQALHDPLTDLPNRSSIMQRLTSAIEHARSADSHVCVLSIRLSRMNEISSTLGHSASDEVIMLAARHLKLNLNHGEILGHAGTNDFVLVLPDCAIDMALEQADRIENILGAGVTLGRVNITLQTEIGISEFPQHGDSAADLLRHSSIARSEAEARHNRVMVYENGREDHYIRQLRIVNDLRSALQRNEVRLQFQPQINLPDGEVRGVEALVRWEHPEFGHLAPDDFVPAAEQAGTIVHLTRFVLSSALRFCKQLQDKGLQLEMSVNISARDLQDEYLPYFALEQLKELGIPPSRLTLEVTESAVMKELHRSIAVLHSLRDIGIRIAMDDFGTGHSSLSQLKNIPLHELKIDKSFIMRLLQDRQNEAIVQTSVELAHNMKLEVVAEGVEDENTLRHLAGIGCEQAQGFYISKPLDPDELIQWLEQYKPLVIGNRRSRKRAFTAR